MPNGPLKETAVTPRDAVEVNRSVIDLGGRPLPDPHRGERIEDYNDTTVAGGRTSGCGHRARVTIPYETPQGTAQFATFCAICDAGPNMPRIAAKTAQRLEEEEAIEAVASQRMAAAMENPTMTHMDSDRPVQHPRLTMPDVQWVNEYDQTSDLPGPREDGGDG